MTHLRSLLIATTALTLSSGLSAQLPNPGLELERGRTALVITDPQNDFLSPRGVAWGVVGASVQANGTVANLQTLLRTAKATGTPVFVSPHYYYPSDHGWKFGGALEQLMHTIGMFDRKGALTVEGFRGSGADWLEQYRQYLEDGETVVSSPHKVYGPETNDLVLQLRKRGISKILLAGMSANLCVEAHLRELLEQGFEVAVIRDATAAARVPEGDGYEAALTNFRYLASAVWTTADTKARMEQALATR
jgi:nicotinamidase-related amidase